KREEPRIPFGWLVERGLLEPGAVLHSFNGRGTARVRADGTLISADHRGSIHQVGAAVQGAPACNGWAFWCYKVDGQLVSLDPRRAQGRAELNGISEGGGHRGGATLPDAASRHPLFAAPRIHFLLT